MSKLTLTGDALKIADIGEFISNKNKITDIAPSALNKVKQSEKLVKKGIEDKRIIYGINTGFGPMASHIISPKQIENLQKNLVLSHAVGMGDSIDGDFVLAAMIIRLNTLVKGHSGVSVDLIQCLKELINNRIIPTVPEHGAVGTSGDLVQLAHIALAVIGKGDAYYKGKVMPVSKIFSQLKIKPYVLKTKEGLALINGTSMMSGIGSVIWLRARYAISSALRNSALALEAINAYEDMLDDTIHQLRPHAGQKLVAKILKDLLSSSKLLEKRDSLKDDNEQLHDVHEIAEDVQQIYSLRCIPQILGPVLDSLKKTKVDLEIEINSVTDNPIVDIKKKKYLHGGNFHGDYIASSVDQLKASLIKLTMLSERRLDFFLNSKINRKFPPFLNLETPGLTLALQGLQFVATSTTARSQSLGYPHHLHSITTNGNNQDVVSMGSDAALIASKVIENAFIVLAIELIALCQCVDYAKVQVGLSKASKSMYKDLRFVFPAVIKDREIHAQLPKVVDLIKNYEAFDL